MSRNTSVTIGDHFADFIERQVKDGRYGSASDVAVSLSTPFDFDDFIKRKRRQAATSK